MTHRVHFPPYLPRGKIDGEPHPVDAAERPVLGQTVPRIEHHVLAVVQLILCQKTLPWKGDASQPRYPLLRTGPPPRSVADLSALGQSRRFAPQQLATSGLPPTADIAHRDYPKSAKPGLMHRSNSELSITSLARARSGRRTVRSSGLRSRWEHTDRRFSPSSFFAK